MKIPSTLLLAWAFWVAPISNSKAALIAYWNFNNLTASTNNGTTYSPTTGSATMTVGVAASDQSGSNRGINSFGGHAANALNSDPAGQSLALQGGASETSTPVQNNGATIIIEIDMTLFSDPILSFSTRRSGTGFNNNQLAYSIDGINYTNFGTAFNPPDSATFAVQSFDLSSVNTLDGDSSVFLRITFDGATSNAGSVRIDNVQINAVPEPSGAAILGSIGMLGLLRRRR